MNDLSIVVLLAVILLGVLALTIYVLTFALRDAMRRITRINEKMLILLGVREGGREAARALLGYARRPRRPLRGIANKDDGGDKKGAAKGKETKDGMRFTVGST